MFQKIQSTLWNLLLDQKPTGNGLSLFFCNLQVMELSNRDPPHSYSCSSNEGLI